MRKRVRLKTQDGQKIFVQLHHWGGGIDRHFRRWTREHDGWRCLESGQVAHPASLFDAFKRATPRWKD